MINYRSRCIYHITLTKATGIQAFGELCGIFPAVGIARSLLGSIIEKQIRNFSSLNPNIRMLQYCIMPNHLHLLLFVTDRIDLNLGHYIGKFKILIHQEYREATGIEKPIFDEDFYDCILHPGRSLDTLFRYIRENPRRLAVRRVHPEFFRRTNNLKIGEKDYHAYGNFQLLDCPFKEQVIVHRADSEETRRRNREQWLYTAANGGVLVSPFISTSEKAIRSEAESVGARFILITHEPIEERYKPSGSEFNLCEAGRLLIISANLPGALLRSTCLAMNTLASAICRQN